MRRLSKEMPFGREMCLTQCRGSGSMLRTAGTTTGGARFTVRNARYVREPDQMPWTANDAERHTHKATTPARNELVTKAELSGKRTPSSVGRREPANNSTNLALGGPMSVLGGHKRKRLHR